MTPYQFGLDLILSGFNRRSRICRHLCLGDPLEAADIRGLDARKNPNYFWPNSARSFSRS